MRLRTLDEWLAEYGESHRHPMNKVVHWICVPAIMWSVLALLWSLPMPAVPPRYALMNWSLPAAVLAFIYYSFLSPRLAVGMLPVVGLMLGTLAWLDAAGAPIPQIAILVFVAAWVAQFWGHHVEGRRPSFFKDVQFLLIGPLWLLAHVFRHAGLST
jgi:uncharacterized membrane protein YGL010W